MGYKNLYEFHLKRYETVFMLHMFRTLAVLYAWPRSMFSHKAVGWVSDRAWTKWWHSVGKRSCWLVPEYELQIIDNAASVMSPWRKWYTNIACRGTAECCRATDLTPTVPPSKHQIRNVSWDASITASSASQPLFFADTDAENCANPMI